MHTEWETRTSDDPKGVQTRGLIIYSGNGRFVRDTGGKFLSVSVNYIDSVFVWSILYSSARCSTCIFIHFAVTAFTVYTLPRFVIVEIQIQLEFLWTFTNSICSRMLSQLEEEEEDDYLNQPIDKNKVQLEWTAIWGIWNTQINTLFRSPQSTRSGCWPLSITLSWRQCHS